MFRLDCRAWLRPCVFVFVFVFVCAFCNVSQAQILVPAGAQLSIGSGAVDAGGSDLLINGQVLVQAGSLTGLRGIEIASGGTLDNGSGQISLAGDWINSGVFSGGSGQVNFVDGLGLAAATIAGNSAFANLAFNSVTGKNFTFLVGSVQSIAAQLTILGAPGTPLQFRSSVPGQIASIDLLPAGTQNIAHVGVSDVYAIGQPLAPDLSNEGGSGNDSGWFGNVLLGEAAALPSSSPIALILLALLLAALALRARGVLNNSEYGVRL
jgi:hypothetical protein